MIFSGISTSKGIAFGKAFIYTSPSFNIKKTEISEADKHKEEQRYEKAVKVAEKELTAIYDRIALIDEGKAAIFSAHIEILNDVVMKEQIIKAVNDTLCTAEYAADTVYNKYIDLFLLMEDGILRERSSDIRDVKNRVLRILTGEHESRVSFLAEEAVVFAHDLSPSDTAELNKENVAAIVTEAGGTVSHTAILARSFCIPAVAGVKDILGAVADGDYVIVDGMKGKVIVNPTVAQINEYTNIKKNVDYESDCLEQFKRLKPVTKDGTHIEVCLNISAINDCELENAAFSDGAGLLRTEFLFMAAGGSPSEEAQFEAYKKAVVAFEGKELVLRTLDIGGDKSIDFFEQPYEENPFLGLRALRLCFERVSLFKTQLRAALRASAYGNLSIMFPMVNSIDDFFKAKKYVLQAKEELKREQIAFDDDVKMGIMIEVPSIALIADIAAKEADFASIGTNDLCQYLMAADRHNPNVKSYYQNYNPALFRLIKYVVDCFKNENKPISVCGELSCEEEAAFAFIGLGIKKLSVNSASLPFIKRLVTKTDMAFAKSAANEIIKMSTASDVERYLVDKLRNCQIIS